jgi:hypothetical protein
MSPCLVTAVDVLREGLVEDVVFIASRVVHGPTGVVHVAVGSQHMVTRPPSSVEGVVGETPRLEVQGERLIIRVGSLRSGQDGAGQRGTDQ